MGQNATNFCQYGSFDNVLSDFLCILSIVFILKCDIIDLSNEREEKRMKCKICKKTIKKGKGHGYKSFYVCKDCFNRIKGHNPNIEAYELHNIINDIGFLKSMFRG